MAHISLQSTSFTDHAVNKSAHALLQKDATLTDLFADSPASVSPVVDLIAKRTRAIRKRLTKNEKYLADQLHTKLNKDQLEAVSHIPQLSFALRELEDLMRQVSLVEKTEHDRIAAQIQRLESDTVAQVESAKREAEDHVNMFFTNVLTLQTVLNSFDVRSANPLHFSADELDILVAFKNALFPTVDSTADFEKLNAATTQTTTLLKNYFDQSASVYFTDNVAYSQLFDLVDRISNPPAPIKFTNDLTEEEVKDDVPVVVSDVAFVPVPAGSINFINPSEVLVPPPMVENWSDEPVEMMPTDTTQVVGPAKDQPEKTRKRRTFQYRKKKTSKQQNTNDVAVNHTGSVEKEQVKEEGEAVLPKTGNKKPFYRVQYRKKQPVDLQSDTTTAATFTPKDTTTSTKNNTERRDNQESTKKTKGTGEKRKFYRKKEKQPIPSQ